MDDQKSFQRVEPGASNQRTPQPSGVPSTDGFRPRDLPGLLGLWRETHGDPAVRIAVLDGPVDLAHPCLQPARRRLRLLPTLASSGGGSQHGTHVTSVLFGQPGTPVEGLAPGCSGLIAPVFTQRPDGHLASASQTDLARAVLQAVEEGAHVINISGGELAEEGQAADFLRDAVRQAVEAGALVVAATGNDACECLHVPAALPGVLSVGATDTAGRPLDRSNWSESLVGKGLVAHGWRVLGALPGGGVGPLSGTSFATPLVAGVAALLLSLQRRHLGHIDTEAVREALLVSARPCDPAATVDCRRLLTGTLDVPGAVAWLRSSWSATAPSLVHSSPPKGEPTMQENETGVRPQDEASEPFTSALQVAGGIPSPFPEDEMFSETDGVIPAAEMSGPSAGAVEAGVTSSGAEAITAAPEARAVSVSCDCQGSRPLGVTTSSSPETGVRPAADGSLGGLHTSTSPFPSGQKVFVLGKLYYDFGTEARRDYFVSQISPQDPWKVYDPKVMARYLNYKAPEDHSMSQPYQRLFGAADPAAEAQKDFEPDPAAANALIWTLFIDQDPVYALVPQDQFAIPSFLRLINDLVTQAESEDENDFRVAISGTVCGSVRLLNGAVVPAISPVTRGMYSWDLDHLLEALGTKNASGAGAQGGDGGTQENLQEEQLANFLRRVYYELRNLGVSSADRAKNFAATNAYQAAQIFREAARAGLRLDKIGVKRSPICRRDSDCWDVALQFFNPDEVFKHARKVWEYTIDVSDVVPVQVGRERHFFIYNDPMG